jgi:predicted dehydrogenase
MTAMGVGVIGAGVISEQYLPNLITAALSDVVMVADLDVSRAAARADEYGVSHHGSVDDLLSRDDIDVVVNLTIPKAHEEVTVACLQAGKHVWSEKPLALDRDAVTRISDQARAAGKHVGCAPDTFLGPGIQTGLRLIADGVIGDVLSATTAFDVSGPESWHPNPDFLYAKGAGPLFDMGPYYLTALVCALGPITEVSALGSQAHPTRVIGSGPRAGESFPVDVPTAVYAQFRFRDGPIAQSSFSFDSQRPRVGVLEIHGTEGSLVFPDPNGFDGSLQLWREGSWQTGPEEIESEGALMTRGVGVIDLIRRAQTGHAPRASSDLAGHVVDVMQSTEESIAVNRPVPLASTVDTPDRVSLDVDPWGV